MPLFICDRCQAIENTAVGHYWGARELGDGKPPRRWWADDDLLGKALCSECTPTEFYDGSKCDKGGKWHGRFPKETATPELIEKFGRSSFVYTAGL